MCVFLGMFIVCRMFVYGLWLCCKSLSLVVFLVMWMLVGYLVVVVVVKMWCRSVGLIE